MEYKDEAFVEMVIKELVNDPSSVKVTRTVDEMGVLLTVEAGPEDVGVIIGRKGETAKAIRHLLRIVGFKHKIRSNLKINTPQDR